MEDSNNANSSGNDKKSNAPSGGDINASSAMKKLHVPKRELYLPVDLLEHRVGAANAGDVNANTLMIQRTLANFGINVAMDSVKVGPSVTQYAFKPQEGVKLSRISALQDDLALALAANSLRMEAPIPGKSLVGIEVPNKVGAIVSMKEMLDSEEFKNRKSNLSLLLGKDVSGKPYIADLAKMPHLLIAGATGTGKSVCIHGVIASLMFQNSPDDLKFIMVDPKRVEMTLYNGIPYLLTPPVTDPKKIVNALKWAVGEMDRRYQILAEAKKINLSSYNESVTEEQKMPYIVIVIDELADLMMLSRGEVEPCIIRIAQLARAVGIHLVLATQRPSVNVITGLIKANVPARIAFSVASSIDSRTVLDETGAEKLIGKGDMLYSAADTPKPVRVQGAYVSDDEIRKLVLHLKTLDYNVDYDDSIVEKKSLITNGGVTASGFNADDDLFEEAVAEITRSRKASTSLLQRKFSIGYARAARLMDLLEEAGIIGPSNGAKAREVYISEDDGNSDDGSSDDFNDSQNGQDDQLI
ncbi:MAG: DNA translocase FtsK [Patescibacteria group bacterium]